jgi:hypothetical protein
MRKSQLLAVAIGALFSCGSAWADDEWDTAYSEPRLIRAKDSEKAAQPERRRHSPPSDHGVPTVLNTDTVGTYFGLGDEFQDQGGADLDRLRSSRSASGQRGSGSESASAHEHVWNDTPDGYGRRSQPSTDDSNAYADENVYGPMWGVPADAVGLDDFSGNPYPGLIGNEDQRQGRSHADHTPGSLASGDSTSGENQSGDKVQRNHKINRRDSNEW